MSERGIAKDLFHNALFMASHYDNTSQSRDRIGSGPINLAHSARAVLRKDKEENRDNVVHFQDFTTQSLRKKCLALRVCLEALIYRTKSF
ncbi:MAG: hypothetical protein OIF58_05980, partial [Cohaesibacter sp.]|nr:hypothetical protein [Cohaesibacter sp.]